MEDEMKKKLNLISKTTNIRSPKKGQRKGR
nr:MAG TPA: hypothetical protein [Caudoviricetes sp.]